MERRITFTMEGLPGDNGYVRLPDFLSGLENFKSVLSRTNRFLAGGTKSSVYYRIVGLSTNSPATVVLEANDVEETSGQASRVIERTLTLLTDVGEGRPLERRDYTLFESIRNLAAPVGKTLASVSVISNGTTLKITPEYRATVELLMAPEETSPSFVRGMLEYINVHGPERVFRVYPVVGPTRLTCHFPDELKKEAIAAIDKHVEIRGVFKYKRIAKFPHEVEVREIRILPDDEGLPVVEKLLGAAPDLTGGMSSVDFVRAIRDAQG